MSQRMHLGQVSILLALLLPATSIHAAALHASGLPQVIENRLAQNYPVDVTFKIKLGDTTSKIKTLQLFYGTDRRGCFTSTALQNLDVSATTPNEGSWTWELKRTATIPAGAQIWWHWEIGLADGTRFATARETALVQDNRYTWRDLSRGDITVHWSDGNADFGRFLLDTAERGLAKVETGMKLKTHEPIQIWIYPKASALDDILFDAPEWTGGVALSSYVTTLIAVAPKDRSFAMQSLPHELTHLLVDQRLNNCVPTRLPTWLEEGLAVYSEPEDANNQLEPLLAALRSRDIAGLSALSNGFQAGGTLARLSYVYGGNVVKYLVKTYGAQKLQNLFDEIKAGTRTESALQDVYGLTVESMDNAWRISVGLEVKAAVQATPPPTVAAQLSTPVPTYPLLTAVPRPRPTQTATPWTTRTVAAIGARQVLPSTTPLALPSSTPIPVTAPAADASLIIGLLVVLIWPILGVTILVATAFVVHADRGRGGER